MRFLHTADWQLGMTRHFLAPDDQSRFSQARIDAIRTMAGIAAERGCAFVVVAGDVFETNQPDRRTIGRALDALAAFTMPVYLLPGNHDTHDPGSVYRTRAFLDGRPASVEVLADATPREPVPGVEVVGAAWTSKRPVVDLTAGCCAALPADGAMRVIVGHGGADVISGDFAQPGTIRIADVESALAEGRARFVALGDRHSTTAVGTSGRIWYAGAPEPTSYREDAAGNVLVVDLDDDDPAAAPVVEPVAVGTWRFVELERAIDGLEDVEALLADLDALPDRERTIVKLKLDGTLSLTATARLEAGLDQRAAVFGALEHPERHTDIVIAPTDDDLDALALRGYAATAMQRLRERAVAGDDGAAAATDALALLVRFSRERGR
jgi:DNA repair exonuclease SbcCD nuclease subunit